MEGRCFLKANFPSKCYVFEVAGWHSAGELSSTKVLQRDTPAFWGDAHVALPCCFAVSGPASMQKQFPRETRSARFAMYGAGRTHLLLVDGELVISRLGFIQPSLPAS